MELPGSAYLFTLATLSVTFAGFCAIVIVLRQTAGKELSGWHLILTRLYIEAGFWAAGFCMLPPLLALCGLSQPVVWRTSSAVIALVMIVYGATYPKRRRLIATEPAPPRRWLLIVIVVGSTLVIAGLLGNAIEFHTNRESPPSQSQRLGRLRAAPPSSSRLSFRFGSAPIPNNALVRRA